MYNLIFLFNPVWLNIIYIYFFYIRGYSQILSCMEQEVGGQLNIMFDDKGGGGFSGKRDFCDEGEGGVQGTQTFA